MPPLATFIQSLIDHPAVSGTATQVFSARERLAQVQETAMSVMNLPTAADSERLTRRVRSVSQRLEGIEDALDRIEQQLRSAADERATHDNAA